MDIQQTGSSTVTELWSDVESPVLAAQSLEDAAQALAAGLYDRFAESIVLSRVFVTAAFCDLPKIDQQFVNALVESTESAPHLKPSTPVLSLIGTGGDQNSWRSRHQSKGHLGIPMISSSFVRAIPMISRLLKELGVPVDWVDSHNSEMIVNTIGLFFVENAATAHDVQGRNIIAAQNFVSDHAIKSVFAVGGAYATGQIAVIIDFCKTSVTRPVAELFLPLAATFIEKTSLHVISGHLFRR